MGVWGALLLDQLDFYLNAHLFPRLEGLTDEEYFWEPVPGSWSLVEGGDGWEMQGSWPEPEPDPPPVTTIGWRLAHIASANIGARANALFGTAPEPGTPMYDPRFLPPIPGSAGDAIALLHEVWGRWRDGFAGLDDLHLLAPLGPVGGPYADDPLAGLVLHVSRETMHHGGEIGLLRDLYLRRTPDRPGGVA